jgi:hypothetical protein
MWTGQNGSSLFQTDNGSIAIFYFFLSKVGIDTVSVWYRYSIDTVSVQYRYDTVSITTCQITVIDSLKKKMYEKKVHFYRYRIVIDILLKMYGKKFTFTAIKSISNWYQYRYRYVIDFINNDKSEFPFCPIHIYSRYI